MCRFVAYHGPDIPLDELLYKPEHSLIDQSEHSVERPEPHNGDGWGVGWYRPERAPEPAVYRTVQPAWGDENMREVSALVETPLYLAHVRAASPGLPVQRLNCHPLKGGRFDPTEEADPDPLEVARRRLLFMHNGRLGAYKRVIRRLRSELDDDVYFGIRGSTDSEHAFAVLQQILGKDALDPSAEDLAEAVVGTLGYLEERKREVGGGDEVTHANFCVTDGRSLVASRFTSPADEDPQSLYVGRAGGFYTDEAIRAEDPGGESAVIVASERLFEDGEVWDRVPANHLVVVTPDREVRMEPIQLT